MTEKLDCPNRPKLCEFPNNEDCEMCREHQDPFKRQEEKVKANPYLYKLVTITR